MLMYSAGEPLLVTVRNQ